MNMILCMPLRSSILDASAIGAWASLKGIAPDCQLIRWIDVDAAILGTVKHYRALAVWGLVNTITFYSKVRMSKDRQCPV